MLLAYAIGALAVIMLGNVVANRVLAPQTASKFRAILVLAGLVLLFVYFVVANSAAKAVWQVISASPPGTFASPKGIVRLCREVEKIATGQVFETVSFLMVVYLTLQTFCIPGTIALNAVCGAVVGMMKGVPMCVLAGTVGASGCFMISSVLGARAAEYFDKRFTKGKGLNRLRSAVQRYRNDLFSLLLFLRLTPILPNWFINLASPVVGVPYWLFATATFIGITPQTYLSVRFGTLVHAESLKSVISVYDTILIALVGFAVIAVNRLRKKFTFED